MSADDPVATASQHEQELAALELTEHPTVKEAYRTVAENWLSRAKLRRHAGAVRRGVRRGDVLGSGVVVESGQAAAEGQLHHPAGAPPRR